MGKLRLVSLPLALSLAARLACGAEEAPCEPERILRLLSESRSWPTLSDIDSNWRPLLKIRRFSSGDGELYFRLEGAGCEANFATRKWNDPADEKVRSVALVVRETTEQDALARSRRLLQVFNAELPTDLSLIVPEHSYFVVFEKTFRLDMRIASEAAQVEVFMMFETDGCWSVILQVVLCEADISACEPVA